MTRAASIRDLADAIFSLLDEGSNVTITRSAGKIVIASTGGDGGGALDDLSDVAITSPATTQVLRHNGSSWVNSAIQDGDLPSTIARDSEITSAVSTHAGLADPHTGYQLESEKDQASGYAGLDSNTRVPVARLGSGTPSSSTVLDGSGAWRALADGDIPSAIARDSEVTSAVSTHEGAADPHTSYQKESEKAAASGYASLDGSTKVPIAQVPTGSSSTTVALGDHNHNATYLALTGGTVSGALKSSSPTAGNGYATGAGGTVAQTPNRTSTVVLNTVCGRITTATTSLAAAAETSFTVTNSTVAVGDVPQVVLISGGTGTPFAWVSNVGNGSFVISITNFHASTADTSADTIYFFVNKAVIA